MRTFTPGQCLVLADKRGVPFLWCEVQNMEGHLVEAYVINGNWDFVLDFADQKMKYSAPGGREEHPIPAILYQGPFPVPAGDYHLGLEWVRNRYQKPRWYVWLLNKYESYQYRWVRFRSALRRSNEAWKKEMTRTTVPRYVKPSDEEDDDIPF